MGFPELNGTPWRWKVQVRSQKGGGDRTGHRAATRLGDVLITSRQLCSLCVGVRNLQGLGGHYGLLIYRREKANEPATHWW